MGKTITKPETGLSVYLVAAALMAFAAFAAFYATAPGGFLSDDFGIIDEVSHSPIADFFRPSVGVAPKGVQFYRPLPLVFLKLNFLLFGMNPTGYWAISVLIHAVNGFLIFLLVRRLTGGVQVSLAAGLVFVLIPLQGESVAWLASVYDRLCLMFSLLGILAYIAIRGRGMPLAYVIPLSFFGLALLSKEMAVAFPALLVLVEAYFWKKGDGLRYSAYRVVPFIAVFGAYMAFRMVVFHGIGGYLNAQGQSRHLLFSMPLVMTALGTLPGYLFFPANRELFGDMTYVYAALGAIYVLIVIALALCRGMNARLSLFGIAWMLVTIPVVLSILPLYPNLMRGRFLYTPLTGFAIFVSGFFMPPAEPRKMAALAKVFLLAALLAGYLFLDSVNYKTWEKAYYIDRSILSQTKRAYTGFPPGSWLYFTNIPDNYAGAFLYGGFLEDALNLTYGYEGDKRIHASISSPDGTSVYGNSRNVEDVIAEGGNVYVFRYSVDNDALVKVFPQ